MSDLEITFSNYANFNGNQHYSTWEKLLQISWINFLETMDSVGHIVSNSKNFL